MKVKLGEIAEIIMGQSPDSSSYNYEDGLPFFQGNADFGEYYPTVRILCNKPKKIANKYDVLISVRAPVGAVNIANNTCAIGRGLAIIRTNANTVNHRYLFYLLKYHRRYIENLGTGSTFKAISKPILNDLCFTIHDIQTQKEIVAVLDKITSLINMRKEQLEKLDILVKSKFIEMFGDPVLNPKGWEKKKLGEVCDVRDGTHDSPKFRFTGYPLVTSKNIVNNQLVLDKVNYISQDDYDKINKRSKVDKGDILLPMIGTIGNPVVINIEPNFAIKNVALIKFNNPNITNTYIYNILTSNYIEYVKNILSRGGTQKFIALADIRKLIIPIPPLDIQNQFAKFVEQVEKNKEKIKSSLNQLETLYNALMQEYFG